MSCKGEKKPYAKAIKSDSKTSRYAYIGFCTAKHITRILYYVCFAVLVYFTSDVVTGERVLPEEVALTTSQLSMIFLWGVLLNLGRKF